MNSAQNITWKSRVANSSHSVMTAIACAPWMASIAELQVVIILSMPGRDASFRDSV